jgi:hypothetical protein
MADRATARVEARILGGAEPSAEGKAGIEAGLAAYV